MSNALTYTLAVISVVIAIGATAIFAPTQLAIVIPVYTTIVVSLLALVKTMQGNQQLQDHSQQLDDLAESNFRQFQSLKSITRDAQMESQITANRPPADSHRQNMQRIATQIDLNQLDLNQPLPSVADQLAEMDRTQQEEAKRKIQVAGQDIQNPPGAPPSYTDH